MNTRTKSGATILLLAAAILFTFGVEPAGALWLDAHVRPGATAGYPRDFQVTIKNAVRWRMCEVVISPHAGAGELRPTEFSHAHVYLNANRSKTPDARNAVSDARGIIVPATYKWSKKTLTYRFRVTAEQLSRVRFEYWDSDAHTPGEVAGGTEYWFNLIDEQQKKETRTP
jgi:hypothetical protein